jgi:hypothetical protein
LFSVPQFGQSCTCYSPTQYWFYKPDYRPESVIKLNLFLFYQGNVENSNLLVRVLKSTAFRCRSTFSKLSTKTPHILPTLKAHWQVCILLVIICDDVPKINNQGTGP